MKVRIFMGRKLKRGRPVVAGLEIKNAFDRKESLIREAVYLNRRDHSRIYFCRHCRTVQLGRPYSIDVQFPGFLALDLLDICAGCVETMAALPPKSKQFGFELSRREVDA